MNTEYKFVFCYSLKNTFIIYYSVKMFLLFEIILGPIIISWSTSIESTKILNESEYRAKLRYTPNDK